MLTQIDETDFYANLPALRKECGDRTVMRCIHFYQENARVVKQVEALENGDFDTFLKFITESGHSSWMYLQNVIPAGYKAHQDVAVALTLCEHYLKGRGAYRVHGGGFAGPSRRLCLMKFWISLWRALIVLWAKEPAMCCPTVPRVA